MHRKKNEEKKNKHFTTMKTSNTKQCVRNAIST